MDTYDVTTLAGLIAPLRGPGNFLRALFFGAAPIEFDTPDVKFDRVFDDLRIAPWVSPYAPGTPDQDKPFQTDSFAPGYTKPLTRIEPDKISKRRPGEPLGGAFTLAQRRDLYFLDYLQKHVNRIDRREEVMSAEILRTGGVIIEGKDYPRSVVSFGRKASLTKALLNTARWGESGVSPFDSLDAFIEEIAEECGAAPSHVVFEKLAWALFAADPKLKDRLDTTYAGNTSAIDLGFKPGVLGSPVFKGRVGTVELYVYNDSYEDVDGTLRKLLQPYDLIVGAPGAYEGTPCYGAIQDPRNNYGAARLFSKNWIEENPGAEILMTQSAPIFVPKRVNASGRMTVR
ncbi:major capsid protein [Sphingomonas sp. Leaf4]|uniref:major capsid protein n=1 Tax=Sphingomonas sp. Leaf4 TaxID=2876553 RepID=UPI001E385E26|nr:major capsid protein [Sphingomonas sp. Leaf4]